MDWMFLANPIFYILLGMLLFVPVVCLVSACEQEQWSVSRDKVGKFLKEWVAATDTSMLGKAMNLAGVSTIVLLLGLGAYGMNRLGDATIAHASGLFRHFGYEAARWASEQEGAQWDDLRFAYRELSWIGSDEAAWEAAKAEMGRLDIRFFRTLAMLFVLIGIAGLIDVLTAVLSRNNAKTEPQSFRKRGDLLILVGILGVIYSVFIWAERQDKFVRNVAARYEDAYLESVRGRPEWPETSPFATHSNKNEFIPGSLYANGRKDGE